MNNRLLLILSVVGILVVGALTLIDFPSDSQATKQNKTVTLANENESLDLSDTDSSAQKEEQTLATHWKWIKRNRIRSDSDTEEDQGQPLPFNEQSVFDALQAVKVDENGDVILDHDALVSLDEALERIYNRLDADSLLTLQDLIKKALPEKTGEQTAQLVGDYKNFLQAKEQFDQIHSAVPAGPQTVASIESDQLLYRQLQTLREVHLGRDTAQRLFQVSDVNAEYMFESIKLGLDNTLSPEQLAAKREQIEAQRREKMGETDSLK